MIFGLGATNMVIKRLVIKKLHGIYDYNVEFFDDLTFIFGENGCGKTTILDIVSSIVTGKLYNLSTYRFEEITLSFREGKKTKLNVVKIKSLNGTLELTLNKDQMQERIEDIRKPNDVYNREEEEFAYVRRFMSTYKFPQYLREKFKYVYLPLSRNSEDGIDTADAYVYRRRRAMLYSEREIANKNYLNDSLRYVEEIIRSGYMKISSLENGINARFRSNILTSTLKVTSDYDFHKLFGALWSKNSKENIEKSRGEYVRMLKALGEWNEETDQRVKGFFDKYLNACIKASNVEEDPQVTVDFVLMSMEFNRIKEIASEAQAVEKEKERIHAPITAFLETVNDFFSVGEDCKKVTISDEGKLNITAESPRRNLSLYNLSSGEKQIIIIFACLIFGLSAGQSGIYIIDEPEASLHLAWQKSFVESIRKVNESVQLIFATHAPEIIGRYSDRAVRLKKEINPSIKGKAEPHDA